jgi:hypothetical protein
MFGSKDTASPLPKGGEAPTLVTMPPTPHAFYRHALRHLTLCKRTQAPPPAPIACKAASVLNTLLNRLRSVEAVLRHTEPLPHSLPGALHPALGRATLMAAPPIHLPLPPCPLHAPSPHQQTLLRHLRLVMSFCPPLPPRKVTTCLRAPLLQQHHW